MKRLAWGLASILWAGTATTGAGPTSPEIIVSAGDVGLKVKAHSDLAEVAHPPFRFREVAGEDKSVYGSRLYLDRATRVGDVRTGRCTGEETLIKVKRPNDSFLEMKTLEDLKGR